MNNLQKAITWLDECKMHLVVPHLEILALKLNIKMDEFDKEEYKEFKDEFEIVQKAMIVSSCSPEFLYQELYGEKAEDKPLEIVLSGTQEKGKIGLKLTPGSKIVKYLDFIRKGNDEIHPPATTPTS